MDTSIIEQQSMGRPSNSESEIEERKNSLLETGSFGRVYLRPLKPCYLELYEDFEKLGKFFLMDNNIIKAIGFIKRLEFIENQDLKI